MSNKLSIPQAKSYILNVSAFIQHGRWIIVTLNGERYATREESKVLDKANAQLDAEFDSKFDEDE